MKPSRSIGLFTILLLIHLPNLLAQSQKPEQDNRPRTASISGRVTLGGKPVGNARVEADEIKMQNGGRMVSAENGEMGSDAMSIALTDGDGRYNITGLREGKYSVFIKLWAYVSEKKDLEGGLNRTVALSEGETLENVDFKLVRGGVITGQVTDSSGKPMIAQFVRLRIIDERGQRQEYVLDGNSEKFLTDDRGIYRIYGLRADRYLVSAGGEQGFGGSGAGKYSRTYYPGTTDENQAKIIELKGGEEVEGINLRLGDSKRAYEALGRVVDAESGKPLSKMMVMCIQTKADEGSQGGFNGTATTDDQGNFRFTGLTSGQYQVRVENFDAILTGSGSPYYVEPVKFEINSDNASNVEMKAKRGATISGVVVIEGPSDPSVKSKLQQMIVIAQTRRESRNEADFEIESANGFARVGADGSFRIPGVRPGKVTIESQEMLGGKFSILRIERNGAEISEGMEVLERENVTGVRIVLGLGNCTIRGQVNVTGGELPSSWRMSVYAHRDKSVAESSGNMIEVDSKRRFIIEGLLPGEYTLNLMAYPQSNPNSSLPSQTPKSVTQRVTVASGAEVQVTMTLDLSKKEGENR